MYLLIKFYTVVKGSDPISNPTDDNNKIPDMQRKIEREIRSNCSIPKTILFLVNVKYDRLTEKTTQIIINGINERLSSMDDSDSFHHREWLASESGIRFETRSCLDGDLNLRVLITPDKIP